MQPGELRSIEVRLEDLPALSHAERLGKPAAVATAKTASTAGKPRPQAFSVLRARTSHDAVACSVGWGCN
jgi:hypothetical protein